jgi:23S rRNA (pseudouridine1915-N3)-methyltransferase
LKIKLIYIGKTAKSFLIDGENEYFNRLKHYVNIERIEISDIKNNKNLSLEEIKKAEGEKMLNYFTNNDLIILLDDKGKEFTSLEFAQFLEKNQLYTNKNLVFLIGGAFGFSNEIYQKANSKISLSKMTFSHQMIRMIFLEQLYRSYTILKGEKYHHE